MYRKFMYTKELKEEDIWTIWELDAEYDKFMTEKRLLEEFLTKVVEFDSSAKNNLTELNYVKTQKDLRNYDVSLTP